MTTLPSRSNILNASVVTLALDGLPHSLLLATTADRRLNALKVTDLTLRKSLSGLQDSPVLSMAVLKDQYLLSTSMSGQLLLSDLDGNIIDQRRDHSKYVVKVIVHEMPETTLVATAGWDSKVVIYRQSSGQPRRLGEPFATINLTTKPESMVFIQHPLTLEPLLIVSRTDSSFIYYYTTEAVPRLLGRQNLAPHSNAWVAFTPSTLALSPQDPSLLAVGTSSVPHMKLLIVRLLVPLFNQTSDSQEPAPRIRTSLLDDSDATETQASQARAALAIAEKESAAIQIHCTTMAPQTAYSTPAVAWRPDGSGVWSNGDDGAIRGVEVSSGKIASTLQGHEPGSKVRCLWAGLVDTGEGKEEWLISGGFDQKLTVWRSAAS